MIARAGGATPFKPPAAARESIQGHYAGFASRFAAFVADVVVLTGIFLLGLAAFNFAVRILTRDSVHFDRSNVGVVIAYFAWMFIYFALFWGLNGRTAGGAAAVPVLQLITRHPADPAPAG
jgi:hypothetical protein